jgi:hypothetical protein
LQAIKKRRWADAREAVYLPRKNSKTSLVSQMRLIHI